uniref:Putative ovule protein n=1 Tax=Solanum chacoense TaxID=4108 RepID=A0A0V0H7J2_SOLCH
MSTLYFRHLPSFYSRQLVGFKFFICLRLQNFFLHGNDRHHFTSLDALNCSIILLHKKAVPNLSNTHILLYFSLNINFTTCEECCILYHFMLMLPYSSFKFVFIPTSPMEHVILIL